MKINKKYKLILLMLLTIFMLYSQSIIYAAINSKVSITGDAIARIRSNVRINSFKIHEVSDGVISSYEDFSKAYTMSNVTLPKSDSYIIYELVIGNYEDVEMQLSNITGFPSNLTYELIDYNFHDMICDNTGKCFDGVEKTFYLKIKYENYNASGTNYNINLEYEFKEFSNKLIVGTSFRDTIPSNATHLVFTDEKPADGVLLTDVSFEQDMGVVGYLDGTIYKVSTRRTGKRTEANSDSSYMFNGKTLTNIDLSNLDTVNVISMASMFLNCNNLVNIIFGDNFNTSNVTTMKEMFRNCSLLEQLDLSNFTTNKVTDFSYFFRDCSSLKIADVSDFDVSKTLHFNSMFNGCMLLEVIDVSNWNTNTAFNFNDLFKNCQSVKILDVGHFKTTKVELMSSMFENCYLVEYIDVSNWDTSRLKQIQAMFRFCKSLKNIDINHFNVSKVTSIYGVFEQCHSLTTLDISNWDVSNIETSYWVFAGCENLISLDVSNWKFSKTVTFYGMFNSVSSIEYINMNGWEANSISSVRDMFAQCRNLKSVDLRGLNFSETTDFRSMFSNDMKLEKIYVDNGWDTSSATSSDNMFSNCFNLPNFNSSYIDATKAYVGEGGYLSRLSSVVIDNVSYKVEEGMTWEEWANSSFNTLGLVINGIRLKSPTDSNKELLTSSLNNVDISDVIDTTKSYIVASHSGGSND